MAESAPNTATFLTLPLELRLEIYDRVLESQSGEDITLGAVNVHKEPESNCHRLLQSHEAHICTGRSNPLLFENITSLQTDSQRTKSPNHDVNEFEWSPFILLETCTQIRAELATHLRLRWRARHLPVKKLWVSYPLGAVLLDGMYAPLIDVAEEIVCIGCHASCDSSDLKETQEAAVRGLERCVGAFERASLKSITTRLYFPGSQQEAYLRSTTEHRGPMNVILGVETEQVKLDMSVWRGKDGVAWVIDLRRRDVGLASSLSSMNGQEEGDVYAWYEDQGIVKEAEADRYNHDLTDEDEGYSSAATTPGGRQVTMRWPCWWEGEDWIGVLKGEGKQFGAL